MYVAMILCDLTTMYLTPYLPLVKSAILEYFVEYIQTGIVIQRKHL